LLIPGQPDTVRRLLDETAAPLGITLNIPYELQSVAMLRDLVVQDIAATVMPFGSIRKEVEAGTLIAKRIVDPPVHRQLFIIHSDRRPLSPSEHAFKTFLLSLIREETTRWSDIWILIPRRADAIERVHRVGRGRRAREHHAEPISRSGPYRDPDIRSFWSHMRATTPFIASNRRLKSNDIAFTLR
jgi:hypothetical protein